MHVAIVGAGVVGAMCAIHALDAGLRVTLVEPGEPGWEQAASFGNAGWLSTHSILPPAGPGLWKRVPKLLADPLGPLTIRWSYLPRVTPWLLRYMAAGWTIERVAATSRVLRGLLVDAPALHAEVARRAGVLQLIKQQGLMHIYRTRAAFEKDAGAWRIRADNGIAWHELDEAELRHREPDLHERYTFGLHVGEAGHCTDPGAYVAALVAHAGARGAELVRDKATGFRIERRRLRAVRLASQGEVACDSAVIAAGAHSARLAREAGDGVPLETERGYHAWIAAPEAGPRTPANVSDCSVVTTPIGNGLRVAGQVEIAGLTAAPNWRRAELLKESLQSIFPALARDLPSERVRYWMGHRPSVADGLPCIGRASGCSDIIHAFGHGHVGLVAAPRTGRIIAQLLTGETPEAPLEPFSAQRF